jgi:hypothetical protein
MNSPIRKLVLLSMLFLGLTPVLIGAEPAEATEQLPPPAAQPIVLDAAAMSARIDQLIAAGWAAKGIKPAEKSSDAEFIRRLSLDLNGRIPSITNLSDFLTDDRPNKRVIWVDRLMDSRDPDYVKVDEKLAEYYVNNFANFWRTLFFSQTTNQQTAFLGFQLDPFLRKHVKENTGYDQMVRELLTTQPGVFFYNANENKAENIASNVSRLFLGVKLECAQCHDDRSGGSWTRKQFWENAAFFANFNVQGRNNFAQQLPPAGSGPAKIKLPDKDVFVEAKFLDGGQPAWRAGLSPQQVLTEWMTTAENPYFARAAVNRMWYYLLGTGLTDPVDTMSEENPPSHPELLDALAFQFAAHKFDIKFLIRAICGSQAYQLSSVMSDEGQDDPRLFARMAVRGLSPEQLFDSVMVATGFKGPIQGPPQNRFGFGQPNNPQAEFLSKFANNKDKRTETQTSILQSLYLMNSKFMADAVERKDGSLDTIANAGPQVPMTRRITELYIVALSRKPRADEMDRLLKYVENGGPTGDPKKALADIFWALLNSAEFILNH